MNVLITGASGFVGRAVTGEVVRAGHAVRALARRLPRTDDVPVVWVPGSVVSPEALSEAVRGCQAVIHLVGIIGEVGDQTFERVHHEGTLRVLEACRSAGVDRCLHMGALGTRPGAASRYHRTKWAAEEAVRGSGLRWTIFRPSVIQGPGDGFVNLFERMSRWSPVLPVVGRGTARLQPVSVGAVAQAFARALDAEVAIGKTYDLCGPDRLTLPEILATILRVTGRRRIRMRLPGEIARM
ncbi:MAG: complex I NDUFA9 subunit family protein [Verrucomicrobiota bacterium]